MARKPSETVQTSFRIKEGLRRQIEQAAIRRGVSFNTEISMRMKESFDHEALLTIVQAAHEMQEMVERSRRVRRNEELLDQLVAAVNALLTNKCTDPLFTDKVAAVLDAIARSKRGDYSDV
jgi:hypothetical protein